MAYDEPLANRIRILLSAQADISERKMFGGLCFMSHGHMFVGIVGNELMARIGESEAIVALQQPLVREMDFTGKPMKGYVFVASGGIASDAALSHWLQLGLGFAATLPPK